MVSRWELQRVNIQIIEHGGNWDLTVKFFKHHHGLSVVGIEFRAIFATVIGNTADVLWLVGCKNASRLSGSAVTIEIKHLNGSIFLDIPLCLQGIPHLVNALEPKCIGRLLPNDFGIGHTLFHTAHEGIHGGGILLGFCGNVTKLKEGSLDRGFHLFRVSPFPAFGDVISICHGAFHALFDVSRWKAVLYGTESNRRMGKQIDMRMIGPALANLVCEAKIPWMKQMQPFDDRIMVKAAVFWIVDGQRPSAALWVLCSHVMVSFLCYRYLAAPR